MTYIFYDGVDIGEKFRQIYESNDLSKLKLLAASLSDIHAEIRELCDTCGARVIEAGGDEGTIECEPKIALQLMDEIRMTWSSFGLEVLIGSGQSVAEAYKKCKAA